MKDSKNLLITSSWITFTEQIFNAFNGNYGKRILRAFKMTGISSEIDLFCLHQLGEDFKEYLSNTED